MKKILFALMVTGGGLFIGCNSSDQAKTESAETSPELSNVRGQADVQDDVSARNVVQVAISSPDHTTLVKAVQAGGLVDALSNPGPFTVLAPTNAAFDALPPGTVESLLKPENKDKLVDILQYHVIVGVYNAENLSDGQEIGQVNGDHIKISVKDGKIMVNDKATIVASIPASNGVVHVLDAVLFPVHKGGLLHTP